MSRSDFYRREAQRHDREAEEKRQAGLDPKNSAATATRMRRYAEEALAEETRKREAETGQGRLL